MNLLEYEAFTTSVSQEFFIFVNEPIRDNFVFRFDDDLDEYGIHVVKDNKHSIILNKSKLETFSDRGAGIIFHELTHYFDHMEFSYLEVTSRQKFLSLYTEFHAMYIQMLKWTGFKTPYDLKALSPLDCIPSEGKSIPLLDFFLSENAIFKGMLRLYELDTSNSAFIRLLKRALFIGAEFCFASRFVDFQVERVLDLKLLEARFGQPIIELLQLLMVNETIDCLTIKQVLKLYDEITYNEAEKRVLIRSLKK